MKRLRAKDFFIKTDYPDVWAVKIRCKRWREGYEDYSISLLDIKSNHKVLDVGAGEGRFIPKILSKKAMYVG